MAEVWEVVPYNTDREAWRERLHAKSEQNSGLWKSNRDAKQSQLRAMNAPASDTPGTSKPGPKPRPKRPRESKISTVPRTCLICPTVFVPVQNTQVYCSVKCRNRSYKLKGKET